MRAGLAALPATSQDGPWHCPTCEKGTLPAVRLKKHCGYLPRAEWSPDRKRLPVAFCGVPYTPDVCPGWLVRESAPIVEAAQAYAANEAGILDRFDPLGLRVLTLAVLELKRAFNIDTAARMAK